VKAILPDEVSVDVADAGVRRKARRDVDPEVVAAGRREHTICIDCVAVARDGKIGALLQGCREDAGNSSEGAKCEEDE
jgi:hypothetical protein